MLLFKPLQSSPAPILPETTETMLNFEQADRDRKSNLLKTMTLVLGVACSLIAILSIFVQFFLVLPAAFLALAIACTIAGPSYFCAYWLLRIKNLYKPAVSLTITTLFLALTVLYAVIGTKIPLGICFLLPITLLMVLFDEKLPLFLASLYGIIFTVGLYFFQNFTKIYTPLVTLDSDGETLLSLITVLAGTICSGIIIYLPATSQVRALRTRTLSLQKALDELNIKQASGHVVSQEVLAVAAQLTSVASQQAGGSQEQVATVSQVNSSVKELSATANQIKQIVYQVEKATTSMTHDSHQIENTTTNSVVQAREGLRAVSQTLAVSQEVTELNHSLLAQTENLAQRSQQMRQILQLLDSISEETHLLSLNAAIEAAGAGEFGERFAVVAGEVKNLSQRSKKAGHEVVTIVEEISSCSQELKKVAQKGSSRANELEAIAYQTGQRIEELQKVARHAQEQANSISKKAEEVENLTQIIHISTTQQSTASEQVMFSLNELLEVTQQSATGSEVVAKTAHFLEDLSNTLNKTLVETQLDQFEGKEDFAPILPFPQLVKTGS